MFVDQIVEQSQREQGDDSSDQVSGPVDVDPDVVRVGAEVVDDDGRFPEYFGVWKKNRFKL
jgi:hypothetical protein